MSFEVPLEIGGDTPAIHIHFSYPIERVTVKVDRGGTSRSKRKNNITL